MAKRHWYTGLRGACKVPRTLLGWWYEIKPRAFLDRYALDPDRYCSDCAKTARLALAKESAQKPAEVSERPNCGDKRTAADFETGDVCKFYRTQRMGVGETCVFAETGANSRYADNMMRRDGVQGPGMGTLIPGTWCPVWSEP